jgi:hypothetical protein
VVPKNYGGGPDPPRSPPRSDDYSLISQTIVADDVFGYAGVALTDYGNRFAAFHRRIAATAKFSFRDPCA